ncbi:tripartite tricarboxylate transporter substrate binding protein [Roseomonas terrae]|jgi:tripartite-type tricarboxylate transporter receptor subunit TctC|uniref:Tripartite tricarboxylate transporter substrate binding protein n=1 Tax=Neoroseomonas terrae TaxID=424799 RepID=A0ABS5EJ05_9PROT|nr:tripartite tricarboxylate transporter substrate binding protein [Neoroseomonas terrae]MBR0650592.1 tripartite tricarboxylate transporter substrate binding protein [Neoroseomonas terrae]
MHKNDRDLHQRMVRAAPARLTRRSLLGAAGAAMAAPALAQADWPNRPIRLIVPFAPGGSSDVLARLIQPGLGAALGQSVIVENRSGAGSMLGTEFVARSPADGYTLLLADLPYAIVPALQARMPYDVEKDLIPVVMVGAAPLLIFGHPSLPARNAAEFAALAKARPGHYTFGSGGVGAASHMMGELFQAATGTQITHVPYRGGGPAIQDLAAGNLNTVFVTVASAAPQLSSGQITGLGVMAAERMRSHPNIPTFREQGIDLVAEHWWGLLAPARTPDAVVQKIAAAMPAVLAAPGMAERLDALAVIPRSDGPEAFGQRIREDVARYGEIARSRGITAQ